MSTLHSFQARYPGACPDCGGPIRLGDDVHYDDQNQVTHDVCPYPSGALDDEGTPCRDCFTIHAGECL
ncbi:hypothetical protein ACT17_15110 [Mycolicibacterium conceptionense]|uniref:Uncharacterized protein n=1 Tax=Mycolicibacterium conceptionense TaxID=451644 RepID=A0A0J8UB60_9MYCO|nr:hypothetical protein [Mycolicibacterium conceptionense]KMV17610.1 hypothetical protein ACT17_15110 [Mycolicibacterium conceptionense]